MRNLALILILLALSTGKTVLAQRGGITGIITDRIASDRIPFANIVVSSKNNEIPKTGVVSDENGNFIIKDLSFGSYDLIISFIGYQTDTIKNININEKVQQVNIGTVQLNPFTVVLDEAVIEAAPNQVVSKIDRKKYTVGDFETAKGGNAADILNKLPSVTVDPNGVVSVRGTSDFMIYLNGKPTQFEPSVLLGQIAGNSIESIEVISVPTARYEAQGKGGIINIITKRAGLEGLSLSANILSGGAPWGNYTTPLSDFHKNDNRIGGGLNLMYSKNKLSTYGSFTYNDKNVNGTRPGEARLLQKDGSYYHMVSEGERPEWSENYTINLGTDYYLNKNSSISASYFFGYRNDGRSAFYTYDNFYGDADKVPVIGVPVNENRSYNPNKRNRYGIFHTGNIDFLQKILNSSQLTVSLLYEHSDLKNEMENRLYDFVPSSGGIGNLREHFKQTDDTPLDGYRLSIDYGKELPNGHSLSFGIQPQFLKISGAFSFDTLDVLNNIWNDYSAFENAIALTRGIYSGYFDYSADIGKLDFVAGLRLEYTNQIMKIDNPDYFTIFDRPTKTRYDINRLDWFPSFHLNFKVSDKDKVTFATSRRINRPPVNNMTPFLYREHYEVYVVGDPSLKPEYLTNFELSLEKKIGKQSFYLNGFYRGVNNAVFRVNTVYEEENVLIRSYTNSAKTKAAGLEFNANLIAGSFIKFSLSSSLYDNRVEGDIFGYKENNRSLNWNLKGNANAMITKSLKLTLDFDAKSATVTAQGRNEMFYMANAALNYTPKKLKGWDFSLRTLDILGSNNTGLNTHAYNNSGVQIFYQEIEYVRYGPIVEFNISYSLNMTGKSVKKASSAFGKDQF